ncbi:MAG: alpha/beta fold hydrolase [Thermorudis peleae]|nr:alpha/beta fold hydrolase [Thermorudis peleae]
MAQLIVMPKLGLTMTEGRVCRWYKQPGESVQQGEPVVEVETEKITIDVEAPESGVLAEILAPEGATLPVAAPLAVVAAPGEVVDVTAFASSTYAQSSNAPQRDAESALAGAKRAADGFQSSQAETHSGTIVATPAARKLAREHGLDLSQIRGTGPGGRITAEDVERVIAARRTEPGAGEPVTVYSDGLRLSGELFWPQRPLAEPVPAVVLCTGIQGVKSLGMLLLGQALAEAGIAALAFDYRGFGASEGPRGWLDPHLQVRDIRAAIAWLAGDARVDSRWLGLVGMSFGGGHALVAAADDPLVRVVVALAPVTNGRRWLRSLRAEWEWQTLLQQIADDRQKRARGGDGEWVRLDALVPPDPESRLVLETISRQQPGLEVFPRVPLWAGEAIAAYRPEEAAGRLNGRPLLIVHGELDVLVPPEEGVAAAAQATEPKRLMLVPQMGHFTWLRPDHPVFQQVMTEVINWLRMGWNL